MKHPLLLFFLILYCCLSYFQNSQAQTFNGKVKDENGDGIPGVTILNISNSEGTITDVEGNFTIEVNAGEVIQISAIGYATKKLTIGVQNTRDITLEEDVAQLDGVVVTALAVERDKRSVGYAVETIDTRVITEGSNNDILTGLNGRVAGVQITQTSGQVGAPINVVLRGATSLSNGNNQPLFVVDGLPVDNSQPRTGNNTNFANRIADINPEDIASISVLRGPAAAALYGYRAGGGAILINTKTGEGASRLGKKFDISYSAAINFSDPLRLPDYQNEYGIGTGGIYANGSQTIFSWGPRMEGQEIVDFRGVTTNLVPQPNNVRDFYETAVSFTHTLSLSGATEKSTYYFSVADLNQRGMVPDTDFRRTSFRINASTELTDKITSSVNLAYIRSEGDLASGTTGPADRNSVTRNLNFFPRSVDINTLRDYRDADGNLVNYSGVFDNIFFLAEENDNLFNIDRLLAVATINYEPFDWLNFTLRAGTDYYSQSINQIIAPGSTNFLDGQVTEARGNIQETNSDFFMTIQKDFGQNFGIKAIVGHNLRMNYVNNTISSGVGFIVPTLFSINNTEEQNSNQNIQRVRSVGAFADISLSYKDFLFLNLTGRNDWISTVAPENRSFFYPSASLSFVFTDALPFLNNSSVLPFGKLRLSYAQAGNGAVTPYLLENTFSQSIVPFSFDDGAISLPLGGVAGFTADNAGENPGLQTEDVISWEIGTELRFLQNRIGLDFTYYDILLQNSIVNIDASSTTGFTSRIINAGKVRNRGIEILLFATPLKLNNGFRWDFNVNFTLNRNKVEELPEEIGNFVIGTIVGSASANAIVGEPYGVFVGRDYSLSPSGERIVAENGQYVPSDPRIIGNPQPDWLMGVSNTFSFKGFSLSFLWDIRMGGDIFSRTIGEGVFSGQLEETLRDDLGNINTDRRDFIVTGVVDNGNGEFVPNTTPVSAEQFWQVTPTNIDSYGIFDATWIRLRELTFSYRLPQSLLEYTPFGMVKVGFVGRNLFLHTPNIDHIDPETNVTGIGRLQGVDWGGVPSARSWGFNLNLTF